MLKLAVIGAGIMGERLARAASSVPELVEIVAIWDASPDASARLAAALPRLTVAASAEAAMRAADCVYVATPPASHLGYAEAAIAQGKSVFCEKPLSVDIAAACAFLAHHKGARMAVNFPFASSPAVDKLVEWMRDIGAPQSLTIDVAFRAWPRPWQLDAAGWLDRRREGGFTREVVSHFLFLARRLLGPLELGADTIVQYPDDFRAEFDIRARLKAGGVKVALTGNVGMVPKDDHNAWTLRAAGGSVRLRDWSIAERQGADGRFHADPDALPNEQSRMLVLRRQLEEVAKMTRGERHRLATAGEALDVMDIVEAILAA
jgi:predicted dehydrogenase